MSIDEAVKQLSFHKLPVALIMRDVRYLRLFPKTKNKKRKNNLILDFTRGTRNGSERT